VLVGKRGEIRQWSNQIINIFRRHDSLIAVERIKVMNDSHILSRMVAEVAQQDALSGCRKCSIAKCPSILLNLFLPTTPSVDSPFFI